MWGTADETKKPQNCLVSPSAVSTWQETTPEETQERSESIVV